jgi:hypothetical protein
MHKRLRATEPPVLSIADFGLSLGNLVRHFYDGTVERRRFACAVGRNAFHVLWVDANQPCARCCSSQVGR